MADAQLVSQVAERLGWPEVLVERSAEARARAEGVSADEVLQAWAGGGSVAPAEAAPAEPEPAAEEPAVEEQEVEEAAPAAEEPEPSPEPAAEPVPAAAPAAPAAPRAPAPPQLREPTRADDHRFVVSGALGLFLIGLLLTLLLPSLEPVEPTEFAAAWRAYPAFAGGEGPALEEAGLDPAAVARGRRVYLREGCVYCHTQMVRPILTDADLGPATRAGDLVFEDPHVLGIQRIGPDLMHVGAREPTDDVEWVRAHLRDPRSERPWSLMPSYAYLSDADLSDLAQYIVSLKGSVAEEEDEQPEEEDAEAQEPSDEEGEEGSSTTTTVAEDQSG